MELDMNTSGRLTFTEWLRYVEWHSDFAVAQNIGVEMYMLSFKELRRSGSSRAMIDRYKNRKATYIGGSVDSPIVTHYVLENPPTPKFGINIKD
jgi:hypothetical protein